MKRIALLVVMGLALSSVGWAGACAPAPLSTYDAGNTGPGTPGTFSCNIGPLLFSDFSYVSISDGGGYAPSDAGVLVNPLTPGGGESGLAFVGAFLASTNQTADGVIGYTVTCQGCNLTDWLLSMVAGATGSGSASVAEVTTTGQNLFTFVGGGTTIFTDSGPYTPSSSASTTFKDVGASGGTLAGSGGHVSQVENLWSTSAVPEPASLALLGTALFGAGILLRRKLHGDESRN